MTVTEDSGSAKSTPEKEPKFPLPKPSPGGTTIRFDETMLASLVATLMTQMKTDAKVQLTAPRVGGINEHGAWTGYGKDGDMAEPASSTCIRQFSSGGSKNYSTLTNIEEKCWVGLSDRPELLLRMSHESESSPFVDALRAGYESMVLCGLEAVFIIILPDAPSLNMFKEPGRLTESIVLTWIKDLTEDGVWNTDNPGTRHDVCQFDITNLNWSGKAILNSCSAQLRSTIERELEPTQRNGPMVLWKALQCVNQPSNARIRTLTEKLGTFRLKDFPGENCEAYSKAVLHVVDEIRMNQLSSNQVADVPALCLRGLDGATDSTISAMAGDFLFRADGGLSLPDGQALTPESALKEIVKLYKSRHNLGLYAPAQQIQFKGGQAKGLLAQGGGGGDKLKQNRQDQGKGKGGNTDHSTKTCYECGQKGHIRPNCPKKSNGNANSGGNGNGGGNGGGGNGGGNRNGTGGGGGSNNGTQPPRNNGLTPAIAEQTRQAIKVKLETMPPKDTISHDAKFKIEVNNRITAKYCLKCGGRFILGDKAHYTSEHTGPDRSRGRTVRFQDAAGSQPQSNPQASLMRANQAAIVPPEPAPDPEPVESLESRATPLFHSQSVDYDLGSVEIPGDPLSVPTIQSLLMSWLSKD